MEAEKIYCTDGGDKALAYAAMANANRQDPMAMAAMMGNADGTTHMWNTAEVAEAYRQTGRTDKGTLTDGDICYLANMAYADFYPSPLTSTSSCLEYAYRVATDPDGYNGLPFTRWLADMEAKGECLDFARFVE